MLCVFALHSLFLRLSSHGLVMEDELILDGSIISAAFDDALETVSRDHPHLFVKLSRV